MGVGESVGVEETIKSGTPPWGREQAAIKKLALKTSAVRMANRVFFWVMLARIPCGELLSTLVRWIFGL